MLGGGAGARGIALPGRCAKPRKSLIRGPPMTAHVPDPGARRARPDRGARAGPRPGSHADGGTMIDVCSQPGHDHHRAAKDVDETLRRAQEAVSLRGEMALVGAVQGGLHADLRERCARSVSSLDVAVCAIGGVVPLLEAY